MKGTVKFFNTAKGYGFIVPDAAGADVFVHLSGVAEGCKLCENDKVTYDVDQGKKGPLARNVRLAE